MTEDPNRRRSPPGRPTLFDAVRIIGLPDGHSERPAYYTETDTTRIKVGDIGVVIGDWPNNQLRIEAVNSTGAIDWQDHFEPAQLEILPATAATFSRRRINARWADCLGLGQELANSATQQEALGFARKVMAFARQNVDVLIGRLVRRGYRFAAGARAWRPPEEGISESVQELAHRGIYVPVALQAWLMEVGTVDLTGTDPTWPRTGYVGLCDQSSPRREPCYTDPLVLDFSARALLECAEPEDAGPVRIEIAPDVVHKANVSGGAPVYVNADRPSFDTCLIGQRGSFTLLSYLRSAFEWGGFPGFEYIHDAPVETLRQLKAELTRF